MRYKLFLVLILMLMVTTSLAADKAGLQIIADKPGAWIYLNGKEVAVLGDDGFANILVEEGSYTLYIEKLVKNSLMAYRASRKIEVSAGSTTRMDIKLIYGLGKMAKKKWDDDKQALIKDAISRHKMLDIPAGSFTMGSAFNSKEQPTHEVNVPAFKIAKYETTFDLYDLFILDTNNHFPEDNGWGRGKHPVINVSWDDVQLFLTWLNNIAQPLKPYRLPTEAEWEYAARAGTDTPYWWGNESGKNNANCDGCSSLWSDISTAPVGSFNENPFGLTDTAGNVYEWVQDCWNNDYQGAPDNGSAWLRDGCKRRVLRGGSWSYFPKYIRSTARDYSYYDYRSSNDGFRLAQDL